MAARTQPDTRSLSRWGSLGMTCLVGCDKANGRAQQPTLLHPWFDRFFILSYLSQLTLIFWLWLKAAAGLRDLCVFDASLRLPDRHGSSVNDEEKQ